MNNASRTGRLSGKVAIITGAGSAGDGLGIGRAIALAFAREGARVEVVDSIEARARRTCELASGNTRWHVADVSVPSGCENVVRRVLEDNRKVDILVNNVGVIGAPGSADSVDYAGWRETFRVNVDSMLLMSKYCIPAMGTSGSIVNIGSIAGLAGGSPNLAYATSKAAITGLTRTMAAHHGRQGIRVNCIAPGRIDTPLAMAGGSTAAAVASRIQRTLLGTPADANEVALAAVFLASDEARWITGAILPVDAGETAAYGIGDRVGAAPRAT